VSTWLPTYGKVILSQGVRHPEVRLVRIRHRSGHWGNPRADSQITILVGAALGGSVPTANVTIDEIRYTF
jgi:hypothetical protein